MRITEVVRVQNPMGGDYKSQLDRDRAAAAVRAQRQANRDAGKNTAGAKSGTDPQGGVFTPGAVTTKSYNNALTKQFARPAGQGKGLDIMGKPLKQPEPRKIEPAIQTPQQPTTAPTTPDWVGQNTNIPAVMRKPKAQPTIPQPAAQTIASTGTSAPATTPTAQPTQPTSPVTGRPNPYMTPQANMPSEPEQQTMPSEPVKIGGQKLNPNDPTDAKILQMIQKQLPQMPTPQVAAVKKAADKTLAKRKRNKPKNRF